MDNKYRQYRFTVDSLDAEDDGAGRYAWKLDMGHLIQNNSKVFMSIETILSSYTDDLSATNLGEYIDVPGGTVHTIAGETVANCIIQLQHMMICQNQYKTQCYEVRCPNVISRYLWDSDPFDYKPLIYKGPLMLQNTNPKEAYIFEVNPDICNSDFILFVYNNAENANDIYKFSITFILHEYRE